MKSMTTIRTAVEAAGTAAKSARDRTIEAAGAVGTAAKSARDRTIEAAGAVQAVLCEATAIQLVNDSLASLVKGSATIYDKAMDAEYLATHIGGGNHRMFDGGHTLWGAAKAVHDAGGTASEQAAGYVQGLARDMTTTKGLPLATWSKDSYESVSNTLHLPNNWFYDLNSFDASEVIGASVGAVMLVLQWRKPDADRFGKTVGALGLASVVGANPLLIIAAVAGLARLYQTARRDGAGVEAFDGMARGVTAGGGAMLVASGVAALGGPVGVVALAGVAAGVLGGLAMDRVSVAGIVMRMTTMLPDGRQLRESAGAAATRLAEAASNVGTNILSPRRQITGTTNP